MDQGGSCSYIKEFYIVYMVSFRFCGNLVPIMSRFIEMSLVCRMEKNIWQRDPWMLPSWMTSNSTRNWKKDSLILQQVVLVLLRKCSTKRVKNNPTILGGNWKTVRLTPFDNAIKLC